MKTKIVELPLGALVNFRMTLCPTINAPIVQGILKKYCRVPGWQSVLECDGKSTKHYHAKLAVVEILSTGDVARVDAAGIIDVISNVMEVKSR